MGQCGRVCRARGDGPSLAAGGIDLLDAVIIGGGPAGLTAASYLGRFRRQALVIDGDASRARWIPESHNIPGFPHGIGGVALLSSLRAQALRYGASIQSGYVERIIRMEGGFRVHVGSDAFMCRRLLLATGVEDQLPELPGAQQAVLRSLLRICPICDAFEAIGKNIAVIGKGEHAEREAEFLLTYSDRVTLIRVGEAGNADANLRLESEGIRIVETGMSKLEIEADALLLRLRDGSARSFDVFYSALGCMPQNGLAASLGAQMDEANAVRVSAHQETTVPGLYAAGDVVRGLNQVIVAAAEAAIAATHIHNSLRKRRPESARDSRL
jgi:thioredoxin reductase (NADPH)